MKQAILSLFALGITDFVNPTGITLVLLLLTLAKKRSHVLVFIIAAYLSYAGSAIAILYGVDRILLDWIQALIQKYPTQTSITEIIFGVIMLLFFAISCAYIVKALRQKQEMSIEKVFHIKTVTPWFIVLLAVGTTLVEMPSSVSILAYIGVLAIQGIPFITSVVLLCIFALFTMVIPTVIYILFCVLESTKYAKVSAKIKHYCSIFYLFVTPIVLLGLGAFALIDGLTRAF